MNITLKTQKHSKVIDILNKETNTEFKINHIQHYQSLDEKGFGDGGRTEWTYWYKIPNTHSSVKVKIGWYGDDYDNDIVYDVEIFRRTRNTSKLFNTKEWFEMIEFIKKSIKNEIK